MITRFLLLSRCAPLFWLGLGFFDYGIARCRRDHCLQGASGRFSARLGHARRCTQHGQKGRHAAANLLGGHRPRRVLPGLTHCLDERASQHQVLLHNRHDLCPALKLFWGTQARLVAIRTWCFSKR